MVMRVLVTRIHMFSCSQEATWIAGTSPNKSGHDGQEGASTVAIPGLDEAAPATALDRAHPTR